MTKRKVLRPGSLFVGLFMFATSASHVSAQAGAQAGAQPSAHESRPVPRSFVNKASVNLPILLDERARPQLQEVRLYVKRSVQGVWILKEKVAPTQPYFTFKAPHDGEYYFCVATVDRQGRSMPADVAVEKPSLAVVFDTQLPTIEIKTAGASLDGQLVHCEVRDANPDPAKTRFHYQTTDLVWRSLEATAGQADVYCIPAQAAITGKVKVTACDLAGNTITKEFGIGTPESVVAGPSLNGQPGLVTVDSKGEKFVLAPPPDSDKTPRNTERPGPERVEGVPPRANSVKPDMPEANPNQTGPELGPGPDKSVLQTNHEQPASSKRMLVNSTHVFLDYQIEQTGASGVGRVEIWLTRDNGKSWQKLAEDARRKSPAEVDLPGEGQFGVTIVVSNGRGFGATPPSAGTLPDMTIQVDTTRPVAELTGVGNGADGAFQISWRAEDKNLGEECIELYYAAGRDGPWHPIAKALKNTGNYRWSPTQEAGAQAFLRMVVRDMAGNVAIAETQQPIVLDDMSRPRGRLTGVSTTPRTAPREAP